MVFDSSQRPDLFQCNIQTPRTFFPHLVPLALPYSLQVTTRFLGVLIARGFFLYVCECKSPTWVFPPRLFFHCLFPPTPNTARPRAVLFRSGGTTDRTAHGNYRGSPGVTDGRRGQFSPPPPPPVPPFLRPQPAGFAHARVEGAEVAARKAPERSQNQRRESAFSPSLLPPFHSFLLGKKKAIGHFRIRFDASRPTRLPD